MTSHLSAREISECLIGDATFETAAHAGECMACRAEIQRLESSLSRFRTSMREWAAEPAPLPVAAPSAAGKELWGLYPYRKRSWAMALAGQTAAVALLFSAASNPSLRRAVQQVVVLYDPALSEFQPKVDLTQGGGGGGDRSPLPASKGRLPKPSLKQFTPPLAVLNNANPKLPMEPSLIAPPDLSLPQVAMSNYGDPLAPLGPPSNGSGFGGGIGSGKYGGVGPGTGGGFGPGEYGGVGGSVFRAGGGVSAPALLFKVEPEYSEEARKARYQGTVVLSVIVDTQGKAVNMRIIRSLGLGLDEKAIEAVKKWKFRPGFKNGKPVAVFAQIEVNFRLL